MIFNDDSYYVNCYILYLDYYYVIDILLVVEFMCSFND